MNSKNAKDYLPLVQALAEGKTIQMNLTRAWVDVKDNANIYLDNNADRYRIKPEPIERWATITPSGAIRDTFREPPETMRGEDRLIFMREVTDV